MDTTMTTKYRPFRAVKWLSIGTMGILAIFAVLRRIF
jgi:hypothetical protein